MTFDIHVHTQYAENYGDASRPYWKFKGGQTVVLTGLVLGPDLHDRALEAIAVARRDIEFKNDHAEETIIDWTIVDADTLTQDEQDQLKYDGRIFSPSNRFPIASTPVSTRSSFATFGDVFAVTVRPTVCQNTVVTR